MMASHHPTGRQAVRSARSRRAFDAMLLGSVSLLALLVADQRSEARSITSSNGSAGLTTAAQQAATAAAQQAAAAGAQAQASLARAAAAIAAMRKAQQDAAAAAAAIAPAVSDGLGVRGLLPQGGTASNPTAGITANSSTWGGSLPTQTTSGTSTTVSITQAQPKGIFYWDKFNVGPNTTLNFVQSSSDWIALNRVVDPSASPSQILGHINSLGSVYLINGNGIIFGAGAQINVHTLIASSLDIGALAFGDLKSRDTFFLNSGVNNPPSFSVFDPSSGSKSTTFVPGNVTVQAGATINADITTDVVPLGSSGSVYLFGPNVTNNGTITAPTGEVALVAARTIDFVANGYSTLPSSVAVISGTTGLSELRGTEFKISQFASSYSSATGYPSGFGSSTYLPGTGAITHGGLIDASRGIVVMDGDTINVGSLRNAAGNTVTDTSTGNPVQGVISVDTAVDRNGMVMLRAATSITLNGVISSQPVDDAAQPLPSSSTFYVPYVEMTAQGSVTMGSTGLISAPSGVVNLSAVNILAQNNSQNSNLFNGGGNNDVSARASTPQTVTLAPGATIDVAGLQNVELPATYNFISFKPLAEYADEPLQRNGPLYGQTFTIDIRASGTRSDGTKWVGTPLADASGYVNNVGRSVYQLMTTGGSVKLATGLNTNGGTPSVQTAGSVINVAGGYETFLSGMVPTTLLLGTDGRIYSMANANPNISYVGIAGQFSVNHSRANVTDTWSTGTQTYEAGYTQGSNAGSVSVSTVNPSITQGTLYFGSVAGERQIAAGQLPSQGSLSLVAASSIVIGSAPSANFTSQSLLTTTLSAATLSGYGLSGLSVTANDVVVSSGATVTLAPGGTASVMAGAIDVAGGIVAQGGAINMTTDRVTLLASFGSSLFSPPNIPANIYVEGSLDASGRFVNDQGLYGTNASGPAFINGGSIAITTDKSNLNQLDTTGSIRLATGSLLDVSSGGYITATGSPKMASTNALAGNGGSISLELYQGLPWHDSATINPIRPTNGTPAILELDGRLRAYGFARNGSLTVDAADTVRIGGTLQPGETSGILVGGMQSVLPAALLTSGGFGSYTIAAIGDGYTSGYNAHGTSAGNIVVSGVNLTLQQQNLSSLDDYTATPTGTRLGEASSPSLHLLPDDQRTSVNLTLLADSVVLAANSSLQTDPKASITIQGLSSGASTALTGGVNDLPAVRVSLLGSIVDHGGSVFINAVGTFLGPQALVDLSGTLVANSTFGLTKGALTSGTLIQGGTFSVEGGSRSLVAHTTSTYAYGSPQGSYLVADAGARVDVSGDAGTVQVAGAHGATSSIWSWSDAGTVSADVNGFAWGGSFVAMGGRYTDAGGFVHADPRANNGTIILGGGNVNLRQDTTDVTAQLASFDAGTSNPGSIYVAADQLAPFDTVYLYAGGAQGGAGRIFSDMSASDYAYSAPNYGTLSIGGSLNGVNGTLLNWNVANRLQIAAGLIQQAGNASPGPVQISAPYVLLTGGGSAASSGSSSFTASGQTIDIGGAAFAGFGQVSLISSGDLRLTTPKAVDGFITGTNTTPTELSMFTGTLAAAGNVLLSAQRIYPVSSVTFTIQTPGNVSFAAPAASSTALPLSAGGGINVYASNIDQGGNLFAPLGNITLGNSATQSVTLEPGSLTSVTLADTVVPYGATADPGGTVSARNWYYNANLNPLTAPPAKGIVLAGSTVTRAQGSTIDVSGGGDLQAMGWIQGKGGSRDTLTTTPSGQTVYALVPSKNDPVAAVDLQFLTARSADGGTTVVAGDTDPLVGTQITIAGGGGIAAGTYTLYPAHYATLPGAMRVVTYGSNLGKNIASGTTLSDGTVLVTGNTTQSTAPGKISSGETVFAIQTNAVWQQYSEYSFTSANTYFSQVATKQQNSPPPLPMDAGRLAVIAQQSILLNGTVLSAPGQDSAGNVGHGGQLDISAPQLDVVSDAQYLNPDSVTVAYKNAGYVLLDVTQLTGFESILLGGQRVDTTTVTGKGANTTTNTITVITPTATNVVVDTRGDALTAPEVLLAAKQVGQWQQVTQFLSVGSSSNNVLVNLPVYVPVAGTGSVTIKDGSVIRTTGTVHTGLAHNLSPNYLVASDAQSPITAASLAAALGGTLSASGTEIDNANIANLPASWFVNGYQSAPTVVSNAISLTNLSYYANGGVQQPGRGALFVATNDPALTVIGPTATGVSAPALTVKFADVTNAVVAGGGTGKVSGSLTLAGGDTTGNGQVTVEAGAKITTNTLTLQATAASKAIAINTSADDLHATQVNLTAPTIGVGNGGPDSGQSLMLTTANNQFANVQSLTLKALSGPVTLYGDFNPGTQNLTFDAAGIALGSAPAPGTTYTVAASDILTLKSTAAAPYSGKAATTGTTLALVANEIDLGTGPDSFGNAINSNLGLTGFANVNMTASNSVVVKGPGSLTLGLTSGDSVNLNVTTPIIQVNTATAVNSSNFTITSFAGNVSVADIAPRTAVASRPTDSSEIGGSLTITAANIDIASTIQAQAGTVSLNAIAGNLELHTGAYLAAGGYKKTLLDVDTYVAGGKVALYADIGASKPNIAGNVLLDAGSVVDVAQTGGQGYGGEIDVTALRGNATIGAGAQLLGSGGPGLGGRFSLDTLGSADLTALAGMLGSGGISGAITVHSRTGNLDLAAGSTLSANSITLTADDSSSPANGQVIIEGTIDARGYSGESADGTGQAGGQVGLYGKNAVVLTGTGQILASTTHSDERGGDVTLGIDWSAAGNIDLQAGSIIDVSGGTKGGLTGGTVALRAPLDGNNNVKIGNLASTITGARSVTVDGFISIDTTAKGHGIDGSSLTASNGGAAAWDGILDAGGAVSSNGQAVNFGSWTNVTGEKLSVTPGTGYTAPPAISVVTSTHQTIGGTTYVDPQTGASFNQVTDPVTGTTFRSSLQVASVSITNGGSYTTIPSVALTAANGLPLPGWGTSAAATPIMGLNPITVSGVAMSNAANGRIVILLDASGNSIGTGNAVVSNGMLTSVTVAPSVTVTTVPVRLQVIGFGPVTSGFSATMRVAAVTVTGGVGYSSGVNVGFSGGTATATANMGAAVTVTSVTKGYTSTADLPTLTIGGGATATFASQASTGLAGSTDQSGVFMPTTTSNFVPVASSDVFAGSKGTDGATLTISPYQPHVLFVSDVLANFVEGNGLQGTDVTGNWGFGGILSRLNAPGGLISQLGAGVVHFQPGVDLVNSSPSINSGSITVASNLNLAAGTAGNLQTGTISGTKTTFQYFDPSTSYVNFLYRLATPWGSLESGALTLRASGNVNVNASISDGFYQTANYLDANYVAWVRSYLGFPSGNSASDRVIDAAGAYPYYLNTYSSSAVPVAPYQAAGNVISPTSQDLATADLFPNQLRACTTNCSTANVVTVTALSSWTFNLTSGANTSSANPAAVMSLANAQAGNIGDVIVNNHSSYSQPIVGSSGSTQITVNLPTMVRTGTGSIEISAARDVTTADTVAPGVIYAAGVNEPNLASANYSGTSTVAAGNPNGFYAPQLLAYGNGGTQTTGTYYGPPTAAAFPEQGGDVTVTAQRDITGYSISGNKVPQFYQPWLLSDSGVTPTSVAGSEVGVFGAGVFSPAGSQIASQTAWWIQYGSFQEGILSAGGNVTVTAGRDLIDVSVSLPTTARVSGGLSTASLPVTNVYGSGDMVVRAGRNILGGAFYEGSGSATIVAGASIGQNGTVSRFSTSTVQTPDVPLLAVDTGQIAISARGAVTIAGVINPAALHAQSPTFANPLETGTSPQQSLFVSAYGPDSKATVVADTGDLTITIAPTAIGFGLVPAAPSTYPASFEAKALEGSLITTGIQIATNPSVQIPMPGIVLSESDHGTFELLAQNNVDLTFGYPQNSSNLLNGATRPYISAGPSLIDTAFDPLQPNSGYTGALSGGLLAHADDTAQMSTTARIYAVSGSITGTGSYGQRYLNDPLTSGYLRTEINRPANIYAGQDIVDLNLIVQNIHTSDVSTVAAGRNITYTGYNNAGGLQVAGPGYLVVQAGGDIGPFLPANHDFSTQAPVQEGIASVGNSSTTPVGNLYVSRTGGAGASVGFYDEALVGPSSNPRRNDLLVTAAGTRQGADVIALFGTRYGVDDQAVIDNYINPVNAAGVTHNYLGELQTFLAGIGIATTGPQDAWNIFTNAANLATPPVSAVQKNVFVDQVFFAELKAVGAEQQSGVSDSARGYEVINAMFPSSLGYTANALGGGANGANQQVLTGDLNLLHATIQTQLGGSVSLFGPGGGIQVGSLASESNTKLQLRDIGILTLGGGGINTFTDGSVEVNSSRVLTTQGGDVLMWSSNGDLDAGRGSKTTLSAPALQVQFDQNDYASVDLGGFVTGAGIGTLQASSVAQASSLYLLAPRGTIDFGTAGARSSGDAVFVAPVITNGANVSVSGNQSSSITTVSLPSAGALSGSNSAGASSKSGDSATAGGKSDKASIFIVEVVGYGGGEGGGSATPGDDKKKQDTN